MKHSYCQIQCKQNKKKHSDKRKIYIFEIYVRTSHLSCILSHSCLVCLCTFPLICFSFTFLSLLSVVVFVLLFLFCCALVHSSFVFVFFFKFFCTSSLFWFVSFVVHFSTHMFFLVTLLFFFCLLVVWCPGPLICFFLLSFFFCLLVLLCSSPLMCGRSCHHSPTFRPDTFYFLRLKPGKDFQI